MLNAISIKNLAIIKNLDLEFNNGLIVLTGETGAGKSIILDGINMLIGEKITSEMIRSDSEVVFAQGVFGIKGEAEEAAKEYDIYPEDGEIIVRREMDRSGKNKISVNGVRITAANLKEIMGNVVDLVGQHSHQMLLDKKYHIRLLDSFMDEEDNQAKITLGELYKKYIECGKKIKEIEELRADILEKKELYEFQFKELTDAELKAGETEYLESEYKKLFNAGRIIDNLNKAMELLKEGEANALGMIGSAKNSIEGISKYGDEYSAILEKIEGAYYNLEESVYEIESAVADVETNDTKLAEISSRLDKISKLKKKYSRDVDELINHRNELEGKLQSLSYNEHEEKVLKKEQITILENYKEISKKISEKRRKIAIDIEYKIIHELSELNMKNIEFKVVFSEKEGVNREGNDLVEFMISTNKGEELKPLSKIVSGGEVSRIMLAVKSIFAGVDNVSLLIFDEIDTGIGGETLRKVAEKLKALSLKVQIICITHSAQIAALADIHFYIKKEIEEGKTVTKVWQLSDEERVNEIARMFSGESITETVVKHAEELIKEGKKWIMKK